ncbi:MAG: sigma 54-interacting transcriptional regulator [Polyangiaceae bacterium]
MTFWSNGSVAASLPHGGKLVVGRAEGCDLRVLDESVSRQHVAVYGTSPPCIEDLNSANGTMVGNTRIPAHARVPLELSTVVELGDALLVLRSGSVSTADREPVAPDGTGEPSPAMQRVYELVDLVAKTNIPVLLLGRTGVGKGVIAQEIHQRSERAKGPLLRLNCAAIPEQMLESELFGHERGAFTGAREAKPGLLEAASGGTLLLDEVGELAAGAQAKLLHALERGEVLRVGAIAPRPIDTRFIAATNRDLNAEMEAGRFREDLYFRLNGMSITIPPLRERPTEIPALARSFVREACVQLGISPVEITPAALERLTAHPWPGNVRELRSVMVRAALVARGSRIGIEHFEPVAESAASRKATQLRAEVRELELRRVVEVLEQCRNNQVEAAKRLGISRGTLRRRMKELGLLSAKVAKD